MGLQGRNGAIGDFFHSLNADLPASAPASLSLQGFGIGLPLKYWDLVFAFNFPIFAGDPPSHPRKNSQAIEIIEKTAGAGRENLVPAAADGL